MVVELRVLVLAGAYVNTLTNYHKLPHEEKFEF